MIEAVIAIGEPEIKSKVYLHVNVDIVTDMDSLRTLKPGECIEGVIWYQ